MFSQTSMNVSFSGLRVMLMLTVLIWKVPTPVLVETDT